MAFNDPQSITIGTATTPLPRILTKTGAGQFVGADGAVQLEIIPTTGKTKVRTVRLRTSKVTSDPLVTTTNVRVSSLISLTIIRPLDGFSDEETLQQITALNTWGSANSNANFKKLVVGEN